MNNANSDPMSISSPDQGLLFVFGAARSGTTYLGRILEELFDFGMGPEGHFVPEFAQRLGRYGNLAHEANLAKLIEDISQSSMLRIMREKWHDQIRTDITPAMIRAALTEPTYAGVVYAVFHCVAREQGLTRIGNKNPDYWKHLDRLEALFPGRARYLGIVRDGRDVALSDMRMKWGQDNVLACAKTWNQCMQTTADFGRRIGPDRFLEIRYEDLMTETVSTVRNIAGFLHADPSIEIDTMREEEAAPSMKRGNCGKWVDGLTRDEQRIFEAVAGHSLEYLGYETLFERPYVTWRERVTLNARETFRKVRINLAKVGLSS